MPTPDSDRSEELSVAYVSTIAAHAGIKVDNVSRKDYGTDMTFKRLRKRKSDNHYTDMNGINIPCQVKSARSPEWKITEDGIVSYRLKAKNYNDLVTSTYGFSILMCLPPSIDQWLKQDRISLSVWSHYWLMVMVRSVLR